MRKNKYLMLGILFLIVSLLLVRAHMRRQQMSRAQREQTALREVVVAKQTIPKWTVVAPEMVEIQRLDPTKDMIPADAITSLDAVTGKVTRADIFPGRPMASGQLLTQQELGLSAQLPPGKRALTIQVSDTTAVAGFLRPGDQVDVIATFTGESPVSDTLLQGVLVLAVGKSLDQKPLNAVDPNNLVTLAVSPSEARALTFAQTKATLQLVLRPITERMVAVEPAVPAVPAETVRIVEAPVRVRRERPAARLRPARAPRQRRPSPTPVMDLPPPPLPPAKPELIVPIPPPVPPRTAAAPATSERVAAPSSPAPRTVDVIRGTQRETVPVRVTETGNERN